MAEVRWSLTAIDDFQELEDFIARDSILHAITLIDRIVGAGDRLEPTPLLGRGVPEFGRNNRRKLFFAELFICLRDDSVTILRVVHGARDSADLVRRALAD